MTSKAEAHHAGMERGADRLLLEKKKVRRAPGPGCECCKDLDEALSRHTGAALRTGIEAITENAQLSLDGEAHRCAKISSPIKRAEAVLQVIEDRELKKKPGMIPAFRKAVDKYAGTHDADDDIFVAADEELVTVEECIPWPYEVDGAEVLDAVVKVITQHVNLTVEMAHTAALWAAFAHALDLGWFNPRLALCSPVKRCGKTTLVEVLSHLVPRAKPTANVTPAVVFRMIDLYQPTYLIDETDAYLPNNEELRAVLNSGHTRTTAKVDRSIKDANGDWVPKSFSTWCPQVVAGIGNLPGTLDDRSIKLRLQRKPRGVKLLRFRADRATGISDLGRMLARFVLDNQITIQETDIEPPEELHDRAADNWRPLLAIAAAAGGDWPEHAVAAAKALEKLDMDAEDLCVQALADVRDIFIAKYRTARQHILKHDVKQAGELRLFSRELIAALLNMPERPWLECHKGRALNQRGLAQLLKVFGLRTDKNVRRDKAQAKGFALDEFLEAFTRYLPDLPDEHTCDQASSFRNPSVPPSQTNEINDLDPSHLPSQDPSRTTGNGIGTESAAARDGTRDGTRDGSNPAETLAWDAGTAGSQNKGATPHTRQGNGLDPDAETAVIADEIRDGYRCARCACAFTREHGSELDAAGRYVHRDSCPQPAEPAAKPKRKRSRIKGADTTPDVDGLPS